MIDRKSNGTFSSGRIPCPVGTVTIRETIGRGQRAWIKVGQPNTWKPRAQVVWEEVNGPVPIGFVIHHRDEDKLNDAIGNLELVTRARHLELHRAEFEERRIQASIETHRELPWSTKSQRGLITGRHPANCDCSIHKEKS